jgi:Arc/MetJ-type ribon-helix-helix transcriptional regulator
MTDKENKRPALSGFRLPQRAVDNLEYLVNHGYFRNKTEAVVVAIEHITTEYKTRETIAKNED